MGQRQKVKDKNDELFEQQSYFLLGVFKLEAALKGKMKDCVVT